MLPQALLLKRSLLDGDSPAPSMARGTSLRTPSLRDFQGVAPCFPGRSSLSAPCLMVIPPGALHGERG